MSIFAELRRRNVFRVGIAYAVVAWLVMQVADVMIDNIGAPEWLFKGIVLVLAVGFPIALVFAWAFEMTPEGLKREHEVDRSTSIAPQTGRKLDRLIIGVLALAVGYLLVDKLWLAGDTGSESNLPGYLGSESNLPDGVASQKDTAGDLTLTPSIPEQPSIAVLPFVNMSGDPENEYFSDGLTETLLHMLAQLPELKVAARTSSFAFKGKETSIGEIATALGVANILEGSVQKSGERVRVTAQLIRAGDGFHVWSQNYTRPLEDIFAIQDEIANDVVRALDASLLKGGRQLHSASTENFSAYDLYLKAMEQQAIYSYASLEEAEGLFKQALAIDPDYLDAKLGLARNLLMKQATGLLDEDATRERLEPLLAQVRAAEPEHPLARALELLMELQRIVIRTRDEEVALVNQLRELLRVLPTESYLRSWVARALADIGEDQSALDLMQAGLLVDPLSPFLHSRIGRTYREMKRWDEAERFLLRSVELDPRDPAPYHQLSDLYGEMNDITGRVTWMRRAIEADPQDHEIAAVFALMLYQLGLGEEGDEWANRVAALSPTSDLVQALASEKANVAGDWSRTVEIGERMIRDQASMRFGAFETGLFNYVDAAAHQGKEREAYELLVEVKPETADFAAPTAEVQVMVMRWGAAALATAFEDPAVLRERWAGMVELMDTGAYPWRNDEINLVFDARIRGDLDETRRLLLEKELSKPLAEWPARTRTYQSPLFEAVAADPQVATRLAELERERLRMRDEVSELMLQPDWWR